MGGQRAARNDSGRLGPAVQVEDRLHDPDHVTAHEHPELKVLTGDARAGDIGTADVRRCRVRRQHLEVRPRRVVPEPGDREVMRIAGPADAGLEFVECVVRVGGPRREEDFERTRRVVAAASASPMKDKPGRSMNGATSRIVLVDCTTS